MGFVHHAKGLLRGLLVRMALLVAGDATLLVTVRMNSGNEILAGLLSPDSPEAIVISVARVVAPALGLWMMYRGLR